MLDYKNIIIKHYALSLSGSGIARQLGASKSGVNDFLRAFDKCESLSYPLPPGITNYGIAELVYGSVPGSGGRNENIEYAVCICWGILSFNKTYQFYHVSISTADFLILLQNSWNFGIMILPFTVFLVMRCKQDSLNVQRLLRYGSRSKMLGIQFMESAIYAIYHALAVVLIESIAAYSLTGVWINWNEIGSLFYSQTGAVADAGFLGVAITVGMLYFLKYMIVFGFLDLLFWNPRYMFTVWILLIVLAGTDRLGNTGFYQIFSVSFGGWNSPRSIFTLILGGIVIIGTEYLAGVVKIRKQDIF